MSFSEFWWNGASGSGPDPELIANSLRFRGEQYLEAVLPTIGDTTSSAVSLWIKPADIEVNLANTLLSQWNVTGGWQQLFAINFTSSAQSTPYISFSSTTMKATDKVIRDVTSWYHMMLVTNDVGFTLYVNGKEWFLNTVRKNFNFLRAVQTFVGATNSASTYNAQKLRGYMAEFHYVDGGGGLLPTDFAEYNDEGVWVPIKPSGITYGSAGFHLTFDPTQDTDPVVGIGIDSSGNNNHFTAVGFDTDPTSNQYDLTADSPTNNFATINPLEIGWWATGGSTVNSIKAANLTSDTNLYNHNRLTHYPQRGEKLYMEYYCASSSASPYYVGFVPQDQPVGTDYLGSASSRGVGFYKTGLVYYNGAAPANCHPFGASDILQLAYEVDTGKTWMGKNGTWWNSGNPTAGTNPTYTLDNDLLWQFAFNENGNGITGSLNPGQRPFRYTIPDGFTSLTTATRTTAPIPDGREHFQAITGTPLTGQYTKYLTTDGTNGKNFFVSATTGPGFAFDGVADNNATVSSAVQNSILYWDPPAGLVVAQTSLRIYLGAGNGSPGNEYCWVNTPVAGGGAGSALLSGNGWHDLGARLSLTFPLNVNSIYLQGGGIYAGGYLSAVEVDGVILEDGNILDSAKAVFSNALWWIKGRTTTDDHQFVDSLRGGDLTWYCPSVDNEGSFIVPGGEAQAWCWKAGDSNVTNNDGTVQSEVSANTEGGFSIVTYTGNGTGTNTVGHGLTKPPEVILFKNRTPIGGPNAAVNSPIMIHTGMGNWEYILYLNSNAAQSAPGGISNGNNTPPTEKVFAVGSNALVNQATAEIVAYCWHSVPGYSAFGFYQGNGNAQGQTVNCGFRPAFVMYKRIDAAGNWYISDNVVNPFNPANEEAVVNQAVANVGGSYADKDFLANGFRLRTTNADRNASTARYIYMAFAENPFGGKNVSPSNAR